MTNVFPNSNLPTVSQPWGREVQKRVSTLESQFSLQRTNSATIDAQLQASYRRIDNTLNGIIGLGASGSGYTINADNINGGTITGTTLQTSASGQRVVVSNLDQIKFYDSTGTLSGTMEGTAAAGESSFSIYSKSVVNTTLGAPGSMFVMNDIGFSLTVSAPTTELGGVFLIEDTGEAVLATDTSIRLTSGSINLNGFIIDSNGDFDLGDISVSSIYSSGQINSDGNVFGASVTAKDGGGLFGGSLSVSGSVSGSSASFSSISGGDGTFNSALRSSNIPVYTVGGSALAVYATSSAGRLGVQSSSVTTKQDISDLEIDVTKVLQVTPKSFKYNVDVDQYGFEQAPILAGFIAEDLDELGLSKFVNYNQDGQPIAIPYQQYVVALQAVVRNLNHRITILENGATNE